MEKEFKKHLASVYSARGMHFVILPIGHDIPNIISTKVIDNVNDLATVEVVFNCNIVSTRLEALNNYTNNEIKVRNRERNPSID